MMQRFLPCLLLALTAVSLQATEPVPFPLHVVADKPATFELRAAADKPTATTQEFVLHDTEGGPDEKVLLESETLLDNTALRGVLVDVGPTLKTPGISVTLTEEGSKRFAELTKKYLHKRLGIVLGGQLETAPIVNAVLYGGSFQITGNFTLAQVTELVGRLNASLPAHKPPYPVISPNP